MSTKNTPKNLDKTTKNNKKSASEKEVKKGGTEMDKAQVNEVSSDEIDSLAAEIKSLTDELASEKDKGLRIMAEYDNFRKRSQKERSSLYNDACASTIEKLLPVYDNLERALKQETTDEAFKKGIEMTMTQLKEIFGNIGVNEIDATIGTEFDPNFHNAVMHIEDESLGENVIAEEFQKGFILGEKVIRFSTVKTAN